MVLDRIYNITLIIHKYACGQVLTPVVETVTEWLGMGEINWTNPPALYKCAWACWELGYHGSF